MNHAIVDSRCETGTESLSFTMIYWRLSEAHSTSNQQSIINFPCLTNICQSVPVICHRIISLNLKHEPCPIRVLVVRVNTTSIITLKIQPMAKHACRPVIFIATATVGTIEVSQDVREMRISEHDRWIDDESIDHCLDQRRRLALWTSVIIFNDDCISILPNFYRSGEDLRSESVVVGMRYWAFFRYTRAVPGLWMLLCFRLVC